MLRVDQYRGGRESCPDGAAGRGRGGGRGDTEATNVGRQTLHDVGAVLDTACDDRSFYGDDKVDTEDILLHGGCYLQGMA